MPLSPYYAERGHATTRLIIFKFHIPKGGSPLIISRTLIVFILLVMGGGVTGCSSPPAQLPSPEEQLETARRDMEKNRLELAHETLEELKQVTTGTRLGGEVQFLLAENQFKRGNFAEAEVHYGTYLTLYPDGPFSEKALYMRALSKVRQIRRISIGFFKLRSYIPHDRDVSVLSEARGLFDQYIDHYSSGRWINEARQMKTELLVKEGEHELEIATFYLKRDKPEAALARAERLLEGNYPTQILTRARELIQLAGGSPASEVDGTAP